MNSVDHVNPPPTNVTNDYPYSKKRMQREMAPDVRPRRTSYQTTFDAMLRLADHRNNVAMRLGVTFCVWSWCQEAPLCCWSQAVGATCSSWRLLTGLIDPCSNLLGGRLLTLAHADEQK